LQPRCVHTREKPARCPPGTASDPGLRVYAASCASCHGPGGGGGTGPSLRASPLTRAALAQVITQGKGAMPAYPDLKPADLDALLTLLEGWQREGQ